MSNDHTRWILPIKYRRNYAATNDFAAWMKAEINNDVAKFRTAPINEAAGQAFWIIVNLKLPTTLDSTMLFLMPVSQKLNRCVRSHYRFLLRGKQCADIIRTLQSNTKLS